MCRHCELTEYNKNYKSKITFEKIKGAKALRIKTHSVIAKAAYELVEEFLPETFHPRMITIGSSMPDLAPHRRIHSHNPSRAIKEWKAFIDFVERRRYTAPLVSYAAGIMSHYISDTFCYAHNFYNTQIGKHRSYEVEMQVYLENMELRDVSLQSIFESWQLLQKEGSEAYLAMKSEAYQKKVTSLLGEKERMLWDIQNSILNTAVWMLEIAYVVSPARVVRGVAQFA